MVSIAKQTVKFNSKYKCKLSSWPQRSHSFHIGSNAHIIASKRTHKHAYSHSKEALQAQRVVKTCVEATTHHYPQPLDNGIHLDSLHSPREVADVVCHRGLNHDCDQHFPLGHPAWPCECQACQQRRGWCEWPWPCVSGTLVKFRIPSLLHLQKNGKMQFGTWRSGRESQPAAMDTQDWRHGSEPTHTTTHRHLNTEERGNDTEPCPRRPVLQHQHHHHVHVHPIGGGMEKQSRATRQTNTATDVLSLSIQQPHQRAIQIMQRAVPRRGGARENRWGSKQEQPVFKNSPIRSLISGC